MRQRATSLAPSWSSRGNCRVSLVKRQSPPPPTFSPVYFYSRAWLHIRCNYNYTQTTRVLRLRPVFLLPRCAARLPCPPPRITRWCSRAPSCWPLRSTPPANWRSFSLRSSDRWASPVGAGVLLTSSSQFRLRCLLSWVFLRLACSCFSIYRRFVSLGPRRSSPTPAGCSVRFLFCPSAFPVSLSSSSSSPFNTRCLFVCLHMHRF